jgi:hypothetical protein
VKAKLEKLNLPVSIVTLSLAILLTVEKSANRFVPKAAEQERRRTIAAQFESVANNSRNTADFFNNLKNLSGSLYPEESISLVIEVIQKKRSNLQNDGKGFYTEEHFVKARELYGLIYQSVVGGDGPWGVKLNVMPVAERLKQRDANDQKFEEISARSQNSPDGISGIFKDLPAPNFPATTFDEKPRIAIQLSPSTIKR